MKFHSRKDKLYNAIVLFTLLILLFLSYFSFSQIKNQNAVIYFTLGISVSATILMLNSYFNTYYLIKEHILIWKSGFFKGNLKIDSIQKIQKNQTAISGVKAATSFKGILIHYNQYDEVYFSPKNETLFIEELLKINPSIEVI